MGACLAGFPCHHRWGPGVDWRPETIDRRHRPKRGERFSIRCRLLKKISGIGGYHDCLLQNVGSRSRVIWSGGEELQCTFQAIWRPDTTPAGMGVIFSDIESIFTAAYGNL